MTWFRSNPPPPPLTTSAKRYPAAALALPATQWALKPLRTVRLNWAADKQSFTMAACRDEYRTAHKALQEARLKLRAFG
jgi:hypothetical protein